MLNIPEYKEYAGETKIALMDNSSLAFMHELSQRSYPSDGILSVYDLILIPKWVMEEIEDSTYRSTYVEQLQAQGYPIRWIDETKYGAFVNDEDVNLYYIVEAAVSRVSELMRFLRRKVKTEDLIDLPSAEEWMNRLYDEWPIHGRTLSTGRTLKKNAGEISLTILAEIFAWYHDGVDSLTIYTQDTDKRSAGKFSKCYGGYYREYSVNAKVARAIKTVFYALDVVNQGMQKKQSITVRCVDIEDLEKQAEAIRVEQIKLYESYADGVLLRDAYIEKKKALSEKLAALQDSIRIEKEEQECADELDEEIRALTKQASEKTYIGGLTKECVDAFVSMVYLYDDQTMKIEFNCEDVIRRALEKYGA